MIINEVGRGKFRVVNDDGTILDTERPAFGAFQTLDEAKEFMESVEITNEVKQTRRTRGRPKKEE